MTDPWAVVALAGLLLCAGCAPGGSAGQSAPTPSTAPSPAAPFTLTASQIAARVLDPVEVLGTGAKPLPPAKAEADPPGEVLLCGSTYARLGSQAGPVHREMYVTTLPSKLSGFSTHWWRVHVAVYPTPADAQADAGRIARPKACPRSTWVPAQTPGPRRIIYAHRETWQVRPADELHGWARTRAIADAFYARDAGGGDWGHLYVVHDIATRGRVLLVSQYMTRTGDNSTTRVEREASTALDLQVRRLTGADPCDPAPGGAGCGPRRTASPVPSH